MTNLLDLLLEFLFPSKVIEKKVRGMNLKDFESIKEICFDHQTRTLSFFKYKNPVVREAIRQLKYKRSARLSKIFAEIIHSGLLEEISDLSLFENFDKPVLVAIPMYKKEKRERGYNQVELLISELLKIDQKNFESSSGLLKKTKDVPRQTVLNREQRLENIKGVFEASPEVKDKNIILVDDVLTTGTTTTEARKTLEHAGAKNILCVVVAR